MHVFVETFAGAAEGTGERRRAGGKSFERPHVDADQLFGRDADEIGQGAIDAENIVLLVVDHDEVADGIEDFQPVAVGLVHAGEQDGHSRERCWHGRRWRAAVGDLRWRAGRRGRRDRERRRVRPMSRPAGPRCNRSIRDWRRERDPGYRSPGRRRHRWNISAEPR